MKKVYVLTQTILGDGTYYVGVYDNKRQMFKDMKAIMEMCCVDFNEVEEVKETLEQEWTYTTREIESINKKLIVTFNKGNRHLIEVTTGEQEKLEHGTSFISTINQREEAMIN
ncbi:hypothetical protein [Staphylococcus shinii]|uniref:hypothetical protein n=1 Tax=Staphylococcus shinii TaxID=2912228 RepID=UPI003F5543B1